MRIESAILAGVVMVLGIILFVGGLRYISDFNPSRDSTYANAIGGSMLICLGLAPLIYCIVTIRDDILDRKLGAEKEEEEEKEEDEERKV
jgi:uncharacterized membrane protein YgdD (TMEM256/DUF423 family)